MSQERNASFELLRLISMFMIVFYHLIAHGIPTYHDDPMLQTLVYPLHIAVVCFVLITGYFGINLTLQKVISFLIQVIFYSVLVYLVTSLIRGDFSIKQLINACRPITQNQNLWFVRTYFFLMLCMPLISNRSRTTLQYLACLLGLFYINCIVGIWGNDSSLFLGKTVINFLFFYFIGDELRHKRFLKFELNLKKSVLLFICFNILLCSIHYLTFGTKFTPLLSSLALAYNSPLLILNAVLFFNIFTKFKIQSHMIVCLAASVFPIYLIHENQNTGNLLWPYLHNISEEYLLLKFAFLAFMVLIICVIIDKSLSMIYKKVALYICLKLEALLNKLSI